jgi:TolB-like protein
MLKYLLLVLLFIPLSLKADDLDTGLAKLSGDLSAAISKSGSKKISVIDFTDLEGHDSDFGRFLAEQLSVALVNSSKDFAVMDRANMKSILTEHKLTASGLVNPDNARKLGQFAGVDAIVLGSITRFGDSLFITAKAISTETTQVLAAAKITVARTKDIDAMLAPEKVDQPTDQDGQTAETDIQPSAVDTGKDFSAPNSKNTFEHLSVEIVSFKPIQSGGILVVLKLRNQGTPNALKVGLNVSNNGTSGTFVIDDQGNMFRLSDSGNFGSLYPTDAGSAFDAMIDWQQRITFPTIPEAFQGALNKMLPIEPNNETLITLRFTANMGSSVGSQFRLQSEMIVAEMLGGLRCNLKLDSVLIDGIRPK